MEFAINRLRADDSYRTLQEDSVVNPTANYLSNYLWVAVGAVVGASARYFLGLLASRNLTSAFPYSTLIINITGSLILGFFLVFSTERALLDPRWRLLVAIGFCGSYTTFSSYAFESLALMERGQWLLSGLNIVGSNVLCLTAVLAGAALARAL